MPMIEKIVQTAKQTVNAIVDIHNALACPAGTLFDEASMLLSPHLAAGLRQRQNGSSGTRPS
jgi:hypothetical protein